MSKDIRHSGRITAISPEWTDVEFVSSSACASCKASALCGMSESEKKNVRVRTSVFDDFGVGDEVNVVLKASMGFKAVWVAYAIPLVLLVCLVLLLPVFGLSEAMTGLFAVLGVGIYYFLLYIFRDRLKNEYEFKIEKLS